MPQTRGEIMRCIYQSIAMKYKLNYENLCQLTGIRYANIHMLGGGIKDTLLCQMTADATGTTVLAGPTEATVMGNIAVQMIALGEVKDLGAARQGIGASVPLKTYTPDEKDVWAAQLATYSQYLGKSIRK